MLLYLVYDTVNHTCTPPIFAVSLSQAEEALSELNPSNINDLKIHPLLNVNSLYDFFLLSIDENKTLPDFLLNRSAEVTPSATHQVVDAVVIP